MWTSCDRVPKPYVNQRVGPTGKREQSSHCVDVQTMRKGRLPSWREGGRRRGRSWWDRRVRMVWEWTEVGPRLRMEEQRADASPAPMIPLTIGSDFVLLFHDGFWEIFVFIEFQYLNLVHWSFDLWEKNEDKIEKLLIFALMLKRIRTIFFFFLPLRWRLILF